MNEQTGGCCATAEPATQQTEETRKNVYYGPSVDIAETATEYSVYVDVPGAKPESIDVHFENGTLTLRAKVEERTPVGGRLVLREYGVGDFQRTFTVNETIDPAGILAEMKDGVLTLHLPKARAVCPRKIAVSAG